MYSLKVVLIIRANIHDKNTEQASVIQMMSLYLCSTASRYVTIMKNAVLNNDKTQIRESKLVMLNWKLVVYVILYCIGVIHIYPYCIT
jgi:hypothetical protein